MSVDRVPSSSRYAPIIGFSSAVRAGDSIYLSGVTAVAGDGSIVGAGDAYRQAVTCIEKLAAALAALDAALHDVVRTRIYLAAAEHWQAVGRAHGEAFTANAPAATMVVAQLLDPRMLVEIDAVAYTG